jgi:hypothetical protein
MDPTGIDYFKNAFRIYILVIYMKETYLGGNRIFCYPTRICDTDQFFWLI